MREEARWLVITFDELLRRTPFAATLSRMLRLLEEHYHSSVDLEFTLQISDPFTQLPQVKISLLQCRPQSFLQETRPVKIPGQLKEEDIIFSTSFMVPCGYLANIQY